MKNKNIAFFLLLSTHVYAEESTGSDSAQVSVTDTSSTNPIPVSETKDASKNPTPLLLSSLSSPSPVASQTTSTQSSTGSQSSSPSGGSVGNQSSVGTPITVTNPGPVTVTTPLSTNPSTVFQGSQPTPVNTLNPMTRATPNTSTALPQKGSGASLVPTLSPSSGASQPLVDPLKKDPSPSSLPIQGPGSFAENSSSSSSLIKSTVPTPESTSTKPSVQQSSSLSEPQEGIISSQLEFKNSALTPMGSGTEQEAKINTAPDSGDKNPTLVVTVQTPPVQESASTQEKAIPLANQEAPLTTMPLVVSLSSSPPQQVSLQQTEASSAVFPKKNKAAAGTEPSKITLQTTEAIKPSELPSSAQDPSTQVKEKEQLDTDFQKEASKRSVQQDPLSQDPESPSLFPAGTDGLPSPKEKADTLNEKTSLAPIDSMEKTVSSVPLPKEADGGKDKAAPGIPPELDPKLVSEAPLNGEIPPQKEDPLKGENADNKDEAILLQALQKEEEKKKPSIVSRSLAPRVVRNKPSSGYGVPREIKEKIKAYYGTGESAWISGIKDLKKTVEESLTTGDTDLVPMEDQEFLLDISGSNKPEDWAAVLKYLSTAFKASSTSKSWGTSFSKLSNLTNFKKSSSFPGYRSSGGYRGGGGSGGKAKPLPGDASPRSKLGYLISKYGKSIGRSGKDGMSPLFKIWEAEKQKKMQAQLALAKGSRKGMPKGGSQPGAQSIPPELISLMESAAKGRKISPQDYKKMMAMRALLTKKKWKK